MDRIKLSDGDDVDITNSCSQTKPKYQTTNNIYIKVFVASTVLVFNIPTYKSNFIVPAFLYMYGEFFVA